MRCSVVGPVILVAVDDVPVGALLGRVAVGRGELLAERLERAPVVVGHVRRHVRPRVRVRPEHFPTCGVPSDARGDLLATADDAAVDEVAIRLHLGRPPRFGPAVGVTRRVGARSTAAAPLIAELAVEVDTDLARAGDDLAILAPRVEGAAGEVVLGTVGVEHRNDPHLAAVDDVGDALVAAVAARSASRRCTAPSRSSAAHGRGSSRGRRPPAQARPGRRCR